MNPTIAVLLIICVLVLYAYRNHNREFEATTSAIREIWSGNCRLSCRQSEYSSFSGLSGLDRRVATSNCFLTNQTRPGRNCVCESCPCKVIENVLRTCRPATNLYTQSIEMISKGYYNAVKALSDAYNYCGMSCQREGQLFPIKLVGSADNIHFVNNTAVKAENIKIETDQSKKKETKANAKTEQEIDGRDEKKELPDASKKETESGQKEEFTFQKDSLKELPKTGSAFENASVKDKESLKYLSASESSKEIVNDKQSCAKCIEKGKICIGSCPGTNESNNKDKKK